MEEGVANGNIDSDDDTSTSGILQNGHRVGRIVHRRTGFVERKVHHTGFFGKRIDGRAVVKEDLKLESTRHNRIDVEEGRKGGAAVGRRQRAIAHRSRRTGCGNVESNTLGVWHNHVQDRESCRNVHAATSKGSLHSGINAFRDSRFGNGNHVTVRIGVVHRQRTLAGVSIGASRRNHKDVGGPIGKGEFTAQDILTGPIAPIQEGEDVAIGSSRRSRGT